MKKKIIIPIIVCLILVLGLIGFNIWNNKVVSTITLDINPSIEIGLTRNNKVREMKALNDDALLVLPSVYKGVSLDNVIARLTLNVIDKGFAEDGKVTVLVHTENVDSNKIVELVNNNFTQQDIRPEVIVVETITEEEKELASKYNISPAKAAYINSITKESDNITFEELIEKPVNELEETKENGWYCDNGYILDGARCLKEIDRKEASTGEVCPSEYIEENGKCYKESGIIDGDKLVCPEHRTLEGNVCIYERVENAIPTKYTCSKGEAKTRLEAGLTNKDSGDANDIVCVDLSNATHPVSPCEATDGTEHMTSGGKCYWHRAPVIASGCPGKIQVGDSCWDDATGIYICQGVNDGMTYKSKSEYCKGSVKYLDPTVSEYKCNEGTVSGNKCIIKTEEEAFKERICKDGFTKTKEDKCINYNDVVSKEQGFVCEGDNTRLKGNTCIIYEIVDAKQK